MQPRELGDEIQRGAFVGDIRPLELRERDGALPGASVIDRTELDPRGVGPGGVQRVQNRFAATKE